MIHNIKYVFVALSLSIPSLCFSQQNIIPQQASRLNIINYTDEHRSDYSAFIQNAVDALSLNQIVFTSQSAPLLIKDFNQLNLTFIYSFDVNTEHALFNYSKRFNNIGFQLRGIERYPVAGDEIEQIAIRSALANQKIEQLVDTYSNASFHVDIFADSETALSYLKQLTTTDSAINYDMSLALSNLLGTASINDYLAQGGIHNSLEVLTQHLTRSFSSDYAGSSFLLSPTLPCDVSVELALKKLKIFQSIATLLNFNQEFDLETFHRIRDLSVLKSHRQYLASAKELSSDRLANSDNYQIIDAGTLLGVSVKNSNGHHFIIINVDEYSKHALPASFFNAGSFENIITGNEVTRQKNTVLQPGEFLLLSYKP